MPKEVRLSRERGDKEVTGGVGWRIGSRSVGWLGRGCRYGMGARQSAGPPPPLSFPVGHWKVEQGSLAIPPFLKALRVQGVGGRWRQGRGWGAPGAGRKEEEGLAGRA